jgi:hypothetical protein
VFNIDDEFIYMLDPEEEEEYRIPIKEFEKNFYDFDVDDNKVTGWFVTIHSCKGKR